MLERCGCGSSEDVKLVFPCSGGSDVGELTDRAARRLDQNGTAQMDCLAGVGGRVSGIVKTTEAAGQRLAIDGCPVGCASKTLELAGVSPFRHVCVTDLGFEKGRTNVTDDAIAEVVRIAEQTLRVA
ncbi:MAG: putative zinc-binding protein [Candidatus Bipolaricaulis sp.]|nr:putative zinc-binding protein [Candidatus Bipolaricaulis sp.]